MVRFRKNPLNRQFAALAAFALTGLLLPVPGVQAATTMSELSLAVPQSLRADLDQLARLLRERNARADEMNDPAQRAFVVAEHDEDGIHLRLRNGNNDNLPAPEIDIPPEGFSTGADGGFASLTADKAQRQIMTYLREMSERISVPAAPPSLKAEAVITPTLPAGPTAAPHESAQTPSAAAGLIDLSGRPQDEFYFAGLVRHGNGELLARFRTANPDRLGDVIEVPRSEIEQRLKELRTDSYPPLEPLVGFAGYAAAEQAFIERDRILSGTQPARLPASGNLKH